ncbi:MAG: hypothetical protein Q3971_03325 [Moraxella sp.]|nr:hypothetical protein [Moraxella sp.]
MNLKPLVITLFALIATLNPASALVVMSWTFFECTATDNKKITLNDRDGYFVLSYGDMSEPDNRISVRHDKATYHKELNGVPSYVVGASDDDKSYTIFQAQNTNNQPPKAGIIIKKDKQTQTVLCKPDNFPDARYDLGDIFRNLEYYQKDPTRTPAKGRYT